MARRYNTACGKKPYATSLDAKIALARFTRPGASADHREKRAYYCHACKGWHLTSWEARHRPPAKREVTA